MHAEVSSGATHCTHVFEPARSHTAFGAVQVALEEQPLATFASISAQLLSGFAPAQSELLAWQPPTSAITRRARFAPPAATVALAFR